MTKTILNLSFAIFLSTIALHAQSKEVLKNIKMGDELAQQGVDQIDKAIGYYKNALQQDPKNELITSKIGYTYYVAKKYELAIPYLEQTVSITNNFGEEEQFLLARSYQLMGNHDKAIESYQKYLKAFNSNQKISADIKKERIEKVNLYVYQANNAKEIMKKEVPVLTQILGNTINSPYPDYAPIGTSDMKTIYFTSRRPGSTGGKIDKLDNLEFEDIYVTNLGSDGKWSLPIQVPGNINTSSHEATVTLSADGNRMIIYKPSKNGDLYESVLESDGNWSTPKELKGVNSKYREVDASFSPDGNTIYFTSNNPEYATNNSLDILVSQRKKDGTWSKPSNLSKELNTIYNELYVHISSDGKTLYFSSEGHNSIGGYDIFRSTMQENGQWGKPENVGYPINSIGDDVSMFFFKDGKMAWFDSDREGGVGYRDIYKLINLSDYRKLIIVEVREKGSDKVLSANVTLTPIKSEEKSVIKMTLDKDMKYTRESNVFEKFQLDASKKFYSSSSSEISTYFRVIDSAEVPVTKVVYLELANEIPFSGSTYDLETKKSLATTIEVMQNNKKIMSTDSTRKDKFTLSLQRNLPYHIIARADGYLPLRDTFVVDTNLLEKKFYLTKIKLNQKFELKNIYFETGKADLQAESEAELMSLKNFLIENPSVIVEISAHTDNVGNKNYNLKLSDERAKSVVTWLLKNNVPVKQLSSKGYGMTQPIAPNNNEENRQKNRRVEFKVTGIAAN